MSGGPGRQEPDHQHVVVKAAIYAIGSVASGIAAILVAAGSWAIQDGTIRYAITVFGVVASLVMGVVAIYLLRR